MNTVITYSDTVGGGMHQDNYGVNPPINKKKKINLRIGPWVQNREGIALSCYDLKFVLFTIMMSR